MQTNNGDQTGLPKPGSGQDLLNPVTRFIIVDFSFSFLFFSPGNQMSIIDRDNEDFMEEALMEARTAKEAEEVPVGAVIVKDDAIIARAHNMTETLNDPTAHAEMIAITQAAEELGDWRLEDCTIYVTLEPCPMCGGALVQSRIQKLVYGCMDPEGGACGSLYNIPQDNRLNHHLNVEKDVLENKCRSLLQSFFEDRRSG